MGGYWQRVGEKARELVSDGCTMGTSLFRPCCLEHDIHYRTGRTLGGRRLTRRGADERFLRCMQRRSKLGWWSPVAWIRYGAVRAFGGRAWQGAD